MSLTPQITHFCPSLIYLLILNKCSPKKMENSKQIFDLNKCPLNRKVSEVLDKCSSPPKIQKIFGGSLSPSKKNGWNLNGENFEIWKIEKKTEIRAKTEKRGKREKILAIFDVNNGLPEKWRIFSDVNKCPPQKMENIFGSLWCE